jgi:hypothetical protein
MAGDHSRAADKGEPAVVMAYLPRDSCHVIDTWHVMGMRGTGSHDMAVTDVLVPTARTFPFVPEFTPGVPLSGPSLPVPLHTGHVAIESNVGLASNCRGTRRVGHSCGQIARGEVSTAHPQTALTHLEGILEDSCQGLGLVRFLHCSDGNVQGALCVRDAGSRPPSHRAR